MAIAGSRSHPAYSGKKVAGGNAVSVGCSVWLLGCAPLCDALAANSLLFSPELVHKTQVWETPPDKSLLSVPDDDTRSNDVRLVPIRGLNLLAACFPTGIIHLLNTHGVNFTIRSSFVRHTHHVHALALCEHESLIISGGVSRCLPPTNYILIANHSLQQCRDFFFSFFERKHISAQFSQG
jgi:hypothetical protein